MKEISGSTQIFGMNVFNPQAEQFKYLHPKSQSSVTRFSADVSSIFQSRSGDIWISTWGDGVFRYDSNFVFKRNYVHDKKTMLHHLENRSIVHGVLQKMTKEKFG